MSQRSTRLNPHSLSQSFVPPSPNSVSSVSQTSYQIGVDGGGMKTECILVDARGEIVARHLAPGCNPSQAGLEKARAILTEALAALLTQSQISNAKPQITTTLLCMAGNRAFWREAADAMKDFGQITTTDDSLPVLELATGGAAGLVLHAGTGSFVAARAPDGSIHYAGGLGWKFGDPGSGSDLGRRAIGHALLELQGWAPPTALGVALKAHTGLADAAANTRFFYTAEDANARIAGFAPRVLELANDGCAPAQTAVACTVTDLVEYARLVTAKLFGSAVVPCGVSGAILNSPPAIYALKALAETHAWPVDYRFIAEPPIEGVRRLLLKG
ncbi:MAG: ATPase [Lacunisphaera sp.]|nr:ATPase [Lacunisphaera sp.]